MKIIKWIKKCPVFLILTVSGLILALTGAIGRFSIYKDYEFHPVKRPFLALVMEGAGKGTAPWEMAGNIGMGADEFPGRLFAMFQGGSDGQSIDGWKEEEKAGEEESAKGISEEAMPEEGIPVEEAAGEETSASMDGEAAGEDTPAPMDGNAEGDMNALTRSDGGEDAADGIETEERTYEFQTVTEDYFNDAAFIGDSRTVGLFEYGGLEERADFYAKISLTIYNVFSELLGKEEGTGKKITAEEALAQKQYGKVYLMLGINELGTGTTETFMEEYKAVVERIRELQPDAVIFVEGIMKVTADKNAEDPVFNNKNIEEKNAAIAQLADQRTIFYIDVNEVVCDAEGNLNAEYTIDEVHLKAKYYEIWKQFLLEHGIER